ncbi:unnamed protein product [Wuchereria bancrofti]|uniref:Anaphase-promoting complex subunit 4 WD40 domain-containing protein n=1 Tax=Wuchereria bancrofti TaxID=6293 RepID=A0A3P7FWQ2_WUCBA|nr:unnamed protein product [Wuchereria bancrofti]
MEEALKLHRQAIVGSVDGNRLWNKNVASNLVTLCWSGDSSLVLFGLIDGEIQSYDATGVFIYKLRMACLENVELETALNKDLRRATIVSMEWFTPLTQTDEYSNNYQVNFD